MMPVSEATDTPPSQTFAPTGLQTIFLSADGVSTFSALTLLVVRQERHSARKKIEWWGTGVVICQECGANDLLKVKLMSLPPRHLLL